MSKELELLILALYEMDCTLQAEGVLFGYDNSYTIIEAYLKEKGIERKDIDKLAQGIYKKYNN